MSFLGHKNEQLYKENNLLKGQMTDTRHTQEFDTILNYDSSHFYGLGDFSFLIKYKPDSYNLFNLSSNQLQVT
jgi:hypothetical protein